MLAFSVSSREVLGALLLSITLVACGDGDGLPQARTEPQVPDTTFSAPLPVNDDPAVVADTGDDTAAAGGDDQPAAPPVEAPSYTPEQMKSE
jgi:hypothetical protein